MRSELIFVKYTVFMRIGREYSVSIYFLGYKNSVSYLAKCST